MKSIQTLLFFFFSGTCLASITNVVLTGTVKSFDKNTVTLVGEKNHVFTIPRSMVGTNQPLYEYQTIRLPIDIPGGKVSNLNSTKNYR